MVGAALLPGPSGAAASPFPQGVASHATHNSVILWARYPEGGPLTYQVSTKRDFSTITKKGRTAADADNDFAAQLVVSGLKPATNYFFRFRAKDDQAKGRFRTLPSPTKNSTFDFAVSGDSDIYWTHPPEPQDEPFALLRRIKETNPDFFIYLGDTIYSDSEAATEEGVPVALTLEEKWEKYRRNRVSATKALLGAMSVWAQWDDHEVINDYDGAVLAQTDPALLQAGQQAFFDYFPIPSGPTYRMVDVGSQADFFVLDERTFRTQSADETDSPCRNDSGTLDLAPMAPVDVRAAFGLGPADPDCLAHIRDPSRTMLGAEQEQWLKDGLMESDARWKFIVNEVPISQLFALPYDRWEGYEAERTELLTFIQDNGIENVVFLTTDIHANWGGALHLDIATTRNYPVAYEVTSGPIQTCYLECEFDEIAGEGATDSFFGFLSGRKLVELDCVNYDSFAYSHVTVPQSGPLRMQWRDNHKAKGGGGTPLEDCNETLEPGTHPVPAP